MNLKNLFGSEVKYHLDHVSADYIEGWAFSPRGLNSIEIQIDGTAVGVIKPTLCRPDVQAAIPGAPADTGFYFRFSDESYRSRQATVTVVFKQRLGEQLASDPIRIPNLHGYDRSTNRNVTSSPF